MNIEANAILRTIELMSLSIWETDENKLLNYWICLENLANISKSNETSFLFIKKSISNMYYISNKISILADIARSIKYYEMIGMRNDDSVNIPNNFLKDVGAVEIKSNREILNPREFYKNLDKLKEYTTNGKLLDEIENAINFYNDNDEALRVLREKKESVQLTIDYIYKSRNQIVHNGYFEKSLIPYLVKFAEVYARSLLDRIIETYSRDIFDLNQYFTGLEYDVSLLEKRLSNSHYFSILDEI